MAVYTEVAFEDLEVLLRDYEIGRPRSFKGIAEGVENSNFLLRTDCGTFILTLYEKRVRAADLPYFLALLDHLSTRGVACPVPVKTAAGADWATVNDRPAAILSFLEGVSLHRPDADHCAAAGAALAGLHAAGADFPLARANSLGLQAWRQLANATAPRADSVQMGLAQLVESSIRELETAWPVGLPSGVVHADLFPDNVLFMNGSVSGLIDFYFACNDFFSYDLAVMLNAWCFESDGSFNVTKSRNLIAAYLRQQTLGNEELEALPILARGAALRFLLTRLHDWLEHDPTALVRPKDPRDFAKRLRFHRKVTCPSEYGL